jgi:hypothetical protein
MIGATKFGASISKFSDEAKKNMQLAVGEAAMELTKRVIEKTPVDTGRLRSNWQASIDVPAVGEYQGMDEPLARAMGAIHGSFGRVFWLSNNLPYAAPIEYGHSKIKAPLGMVRVSVAEVLQIMQNWRAP